MEMAAAILGGLLAGCGGGSGTGTAQDSGTNKTYLSVEAADADGDALQYQWRVTAGSVENRNARQTVWTLPDGPGLHFAYVVVSDGKGGYAEQQYAVSTDALGTTAPVRTALSLAPPAVTEPEGATMRLRFISRDDTLFVSAGGGAAQLRRVYLADVQTEVVDQANAQVVFAGLSDLSGEVHLPKLESGKAYAVRCATSQDAPLNACATTFTAGTDAEVVSVSPSLPSAQNLRLHGHVALADGGICGERNEFFGLQSAATVQLRQADGTPLSKAVRVNRFGDYALDAAVPVKAALKLRVACEGYDATLDVPASPDAAGYVAASPIASSIELSHAIPGRRPRIVKVVANGADGNVRGRMVVPEAGASSDALPGAEHFLTYKGKDTRRSACVYYRSLGATKDCDAQGNMVEPISFEDWKRKNKARPYDAGNEEVAANFINRMDLNLVRRMVATRSAADNIAFYVCNHPGPQGTSQKEVDEVIATGLGDEKRVACVAMEWSPSPGVNGGKPFTKFFTFAPDGALVPSVNLDGRGEKYMPGACVACHGGSKYNGRFPEKGNPSSYLGAGFLPFDTGNYLFSTELSLTEPAQSEAFYKLNQLVRATETSDDTATSRLIKGWYANGGSHTLDKAYVPEPWRIADATPATAGAARFYRDVVGTSCRTCHVALGTRFDWDSTVLDPGRASTHVCGGTPDLARNATMPNALIPRDRLSDRVGADTGLAALMRKFLGCDAPSPDPAYARR